MNDKDLQAGKVEFYPQVADLQPSGWWAGSPIGPVCTGKLTKIPHATRGNAARIEYDNDGIRWFNSAGELVFEIPFAHDPNYDPPWLCGGCEDCRELHDARMNTVDQNA